MAFLGDPMPYDVTDVTQTTSSALSMRVWTSCPETTAAVPLSRDDEGSKPVLPDPSDRFRAEVRQRSNIEADAPTRGQVLLFFVPHRKVASASGPALGYPKISYDTGRVFASEPPVHNVEL
jgi:hypothetical protein